MDIKVVAWNTTRGCSKISPGCDHCRAKTRHDVNVHFSWYDSPFDQVSFIEKQLRFPLRYASERMFLVNNISDTFQDEVTDDQIQSLIDIMALSEKHIFYIQTKRPTRAIGFDWPSNVWLGVSIESQDYLWRMEELRKTNATTKWIAFEPILGPMGDDIVLDGINWVVVGVELGPLRRPYRIPWLRQVRDQCVQQGVPLFFRGEHYTRKSKQPDLLDGKVWHNYPNGFKEKINTNEGKTSCRKDSIHS